MNKPCQACQTPTFYEAIILGDTDFAAILPHLCHPCAKVRELANAETTRQALIEDAVAHCRLHIPPLLHGTDVKHPDYNLALHNALRSAYRKDPTRNILVTGPAGRCKSRSLARLCLLAALDGKKSAWTNAHKFAELAELYANYKTRQNATESINKLKWSPILVFDDLGKFGWSKKIEELFFAVLDHRYGQRLPTWFSANTHPHHLLLDGYFGKDSGPPIVGRILENANEFDVTPKPSVP